MDIPLFKLGEIKITRSVMRLFQDEALCPEEFLCRHVHGSWHEITPEERSANLASIENDERIITCHSTPGGNRIGIVTDGMRKTTTIFLECDCD